LMTISYDNMQKLLHQLRRGNEINAAIDHYVMMKMLYQRTFLLNLDATVRYKEFMREYSQILQRVPLSYIANFLGKYLCALSSKTQADLKDKLKNYLNSFPLLFFTKW